MWCTKLQRSHSDERINVEVAMREKGVGWILRALKDRSAGDQPGPESDAMDVDSEGESGFFFALAMYLNFF